MAYSIHKSDGTLVSVPDNIIDTVYYNPIGGSTGAGMGIQLLGQNSISYGPAVAQNFLQMQENFSSATVPLDTYSLQGQLWFNKTSGTTGTLYVRTSDAGSGGIANWRQIVVTDATGNVVVGGTITATEFIGPVSSVAGGAANRIVVQTATDTTGFIAAPTISGTFLEWNGSTFIWNTTPVTGTVTSVGVSSANSALSVSGSPITSSGTITLTANNFTTSNPGVVPGSGGGSSNFLRADGTWAIPPGTAPGGTVTSVGVSTAGTYSSAISVGGSPVTTSGTITITPNGFGTSTPGVVPASGGGTANFLRADGTWATPPSSSGTVTSVGVAASGANASAITIGSSPVTTSGTITIAPNTFTSGAPGVVPASGGGAVNFLRADGTWTSPGSVSVSDFTSNQAFNTTSGYQKFPGGFMMQWVETFTTPNQTITVTYPIAFPTKSYIPHWSAYDSSGENFPDQVVASIASYSTSGCTVTIGANGGSTSRNFWLAVSVFGH